MTSHNNIYIGKWFLPEEPDRKIFGTLSFSKEDKPVLLVFEKLGDSTSFTFDNFQQITGHVYNQNDKKDYTIELINVMQISGNYHSSSKFTYKTNEYLLAKGFLKPTLLLFKDIYLSADILNDWIKPFGNIKEEMSDKSEFNFSIEYTQPASFKLFVEDNLSIYCYFRGSYTWKMNRSGTAIESRWINLELKKGGALDEFHKLVSSLENLLTLLFNNQVKFTSTELKDTQDITYTHYFAGRKDNFITNKSSKQGIGFDYFKSNSQIIIGEWIKKEEELRLLVNNFFTAFGNKTMYLENRFVAYLSLLEQYHKLRFADYNPKGK